MLSFVAAEDWWSLELHGITHTYQREDEASPSRSLAWE